MARLPFDLCGGNNAFATVFEWFYYYSHASYNIYPPNTHISLYCCTAHTTAKMKWLWNELNETLWWTTGAGCATGTLRRLPILSRPIRPMCIGAAVTQIIQYCSTEIIIVEVMRNAKRYIHWIWLINSRSWTTMTGRHLLIHSHIFSNIISDQTVTGHRISTSMCD